MRLFSVVFIVLATLLFPFCSKSQQAGKFDYYVLNMSWSPEYCYSHRGSPECGRRLGLIVHGLWPQYNNAPRGPENCGNEPGLSNPAGMLDIMPSVGLIKHEWLTHGTCSGLSADDYFRLIRSLFLGFHLPTELREANSQRILRAAILKRDILQANPSLSDTGVVLTCTGPYLKEVEVCFSRNGVPRPCGAIRSCSAPSLRIPPIR